MSSADWSIWSDHFHAAIQAESHGADGCQAPASLAGSLLEDYIERNTGSPYQPGRSTKTPPRGFGLEASTTWTSSLGTITLVLRTDDDELVDEAYETLESLVENAIHGRVPEWHGNQPSEHFPTPDYAWVPVDDETPPGDAEDEEEVPA